jgi:hypothetical protein
MFVYDLHREFHDQIQFIGQLPIESRISDKEVSLKAFFTRIFRIPRREIVAKFQGSALPHEPAPMAALRSINDLSAPSSANIKTVLETNVRDGSFELKPALINKVQQRPFCGKASEDANAHLQHFFEIYSTFTIQGVTQVAIRLRLFPFSLLGKAKQWFYSNKEAMST